MKIIRNSLTRVALLALPLCALAETTQPVLVTGKVTNTPPIR
jgi:hypothetical protein